MTDGMPDDNDGGSGRPRGPGARGRAYSAAKQEFARRLQKRLNELNMSQSDLARELARQLGEKNVSRAGVSNYIRAIAFPGPRKLKAMSDILGVLPEDLVPEKVMPVAMRSRDSDSFFEGPERRTVGMTITQDGNIYLQINQAVPFDKAMAILKLLKED